MKKTAFLFLATINSICAFSQSVNFGLVIETTAPKIPGGSDTTTRLGATTKVIGKVSTYSGSYICCGVQWGAGPLPETNYFNQAPNTKFLGIKDVASAGVLSKYSITIENLPSGKYSYRSFVYLLNNKQGLGTNFTVYGNTISFEIPEADGSVSITNNSITTGNIVKCLYGSQILKGSAPGGGLNNTYMYQWQRSADAANWTDITDAANQDYIVPSVAAPAANVIVYYRRKVSSGVRRDFSTPVSITYVTASSATTVNVTDSITNDRASFGTGHTDMHTVSLSADPSQKFGDYTTIWQNSSDGRNFYDTTIQGAAFSINNPSNFMWYTARIYYQTQNNCSAAGNAIGALADLEGNAYTAVKIGTQSWLKQNLMSTSYNNGTSIMNIDNSSGNNWLTTAQGAYCWYNDTYNKNIALGALYNRYVAINTANNVCPQGWSVAAQADWDKLIKTISGTTPVPEVSVPVAGGDLKRKDIWLAPNTGATNKYNFSALPGNFRYGNPGHSNYYPNGHYARFWASDAGTNISLGMDYNSDTFTKYNVDAANSGFSIRCVKTAP